MKAIPFLTARLRIAGLGEKKNLSGCFQAGSRAASLSVAMQTLRYLQGL